MVTISQEELYRLVTQEKGFCKSIFKSRYGGYKVYMQSTCRKSLINILAFDPPIMHKGGILFADELDLCPILVAEPCNGKSRFIDIGSYVISLQSPKDNENSVDFATLRLYDKSDGSVWNASKEVADLGSVYAGRLLVLEDRLFVVCNKGCPTFFAVIGKALKKIAPVMAEQIMRNFVLDWYLQDALLKAFPEAGWQDENGILINPATGNVPGMLQILAIKGRHKARPEQMKLDFVKLGRILARNEKKDTPTVKYIGAGHLLFPL